MLMVEPSSLRYEDESSVSMQDDDHLLERISSLENQLARLSDKLEKGLDLLLRQARNAYQDRLLLETLVDMLVETRTIDRKKLTKLWDQRFDRETRATERSERLDALRTRILAQATAALDPRSFRQLVAQGFEQVGRRETASGVRTLERAAALAPDNGPLNAYLGEHFFAGRKTALARDYLERARRVEQGDARVCLLLGLLCGDEADTARARELLEESVQLGGSTYAAHYALGRISAAVDDWRGALVEFKRALAVRPSPEAHYVLGLVYYQLDRRRMASRHMLKAVENDPEYAEAFYVLGLLHFRAGEKEQAAKAFEAAYVASKGEGELYRKAKRRLRSLREAPPPPELFGVAGAGRRRLVTGGDRRLAALLQADAVEAVTAR